MITLDAFLVFLFAASIPVTYIFTIRWIFQKADGEVPADKKIKVERHAERTTRPSQQHSRIHQFSHAA